MIEPPKLHTEARKDYDLCDLEALSKWAVQLGLQFQPTIRASFERLVEVIGTQDFPEQYLILYEEVMAHRDEIMLTSTVISSNNAKNAEINSHASSIALIVPSKAKIIQTYPSFMYKRFSGTSYTRTSFSKLDKRFSSPPVLSNNSTSSGWQFKKFIDPTSPSSEIRSPPPSVIKSPSAEVDNSFISAVDSSSMTDNEAMVAESIANKPLKGNNLKRSSRNLRSRPETSQNLE